MDFLQEHIPELKVRAYFVNFDGIYEADTSLASGLTA